MLRFFFCKFSGEDDYIIRRCDSSVQMSIALIGFFVMIVFLGCWVSASLFMAHLFAGNEWMSLLVGIIWAMLITNLYLLLLYTITPSLLPTAKQTEKTQPQAPVGTKSEIPTTETTSPQLFNIELVEMPKDEPTAPQLFNIQLVDTPQPETPVVPLSNAQVIETPKAKTIINPPALDSSLSLSIIFRISLILLLAIIIIQPFNVLIFSPSFEASHHYAQEIRSILATHRLAWWTTFAGCTIFLLPVYWKYAIRNRGGFYEHKKLIETQLVQDNYNEFKDAYARIFKEKMEMYNSQTLERMTPLLNKLAQANPDAYQKHYTELQSELTTDAIVKYETWGDHPFKTIPKKETSILLSEKDFLKDFYSEQP